MTDTTYEKIGTTITIESKKEDGIKLCLLHPLEVFWLNKKAYMMTNLQDASLPLVVSLSDGSAVAMSPDCKVFPVEAEVVVSSRPVKEIRPFFEKREVSINWYLEEK